jgi:Tfp pilus assembly protein PilF
LKRKTQPDLDAFTQTEILTAEGDVELAKGSAASAVQLQKQALASLKREEPYLSLAHACEKLGDVSCAIDAYRGYLAMKGDILRDDAATDYILAQLALANLYCRNGEEQQAHLLYSSVSSVRSSGSSGSRLFSNLPANESCPGKPGT